MCDCILFIHFVQQAGATSSSTSCIGPETRRSSAVISMEWRSPWSTTPARTTNYGTSYNYSKCCPLQTKSICPSVQRTLCFRWHQMRSAERFLLAHLSRRLKWANVIAHRPSSVRPSVNFHIFDFSSETAEPNSTKLDRKQDLNALYQVCVFRADRKNKMAALASDWLRHFRLLLWNCWTEFNETWQEARSQRPLPSLCFSGRSEKQDGRPCLWLTETFSTSPLKLLNGIQWNLTGSKISTSSTKFVFLGPIGKTRWPPWPLIGWDVFDFSSETAEWNSTKLDRKQDLKALYQVCVFRADWKNKMAALASDWPRHFRILLWNRWTEFDETW